MSQDSVAGAVTGYGLDDGGIGIRVPIGTLGSTQPPIQRLPGALPPGGKATGA
jgi:hypothetical protein